MISPRFKRLFELPWETRFVNRFPGDPEQGNYSRPVQDIAYSNVPPTPVTAPKLVAWSDPLASSLGISRPDPEDRVSIGLLSGNTILPGMTPYASRYGGHQFGNWAGQLGDGRAITLGEVLSPDLGRFEYQLKGAGPTPYSRRADGRAVLRSSIREFLCSEAMHFLGVPTTRALSLIATGDSVVRDLFYNGNPKPEPGAIVCRVSPTFLRFGHFEILARSGENSLLKNLAQFAIQEYYPELSLTDPDVYGKFLDEIALRTAQMISHWMRVGFVHGVMNTDNMSILGLTIDYGPYGWLEAYDPNWTPNTTDATGRRYRFGNQPTIAHWNLMRLCEALYPLIQKEERLYESLAIYKNTFEQEYSQTLARKLGLRSIEGAERMRWIDTLFQLLQGSETDFTLFFRSLPRWTSNPSDFLTTISPAFYSEDSVSNELKSQWNDWALEYRTWIDQDGLPQEQRASSMLKANPKYVLRNYLAQNAILAAEKGDYSFLDRLQRVLQNPYEEQLQEEDLAAKRPEWAKNAPGCSALSCSS